jgi:integrase
MKAGLPARTAGTCPRHCPGSPADPGPEAELADLRSTRRPSRSQSAANIRRYARLTTGIRTEEARALRWENISFGDPDADPPVPASVEVWRSVRAHEDTKTGRSRRTLQLPQLAVDTLIEHRRETGGPGLVFCTKTGEPLDAANVRREFRTACKTAGIGTTWTPRELRHSFVSLMSDSGVPVEEIAPLVGHANSRTTETVYRHQLKPIMTSGAEAMDRLLARSG